MFPLMESSTPPSADESTAATRPHAYLAGFWPRLGAALIDFFILFLLGWLLAVFLEPSFARLGQAGRLIGFAIAGIYFSIFSSSIGNGQTVGKRILNLRVVRAERSVPGLLRAIGRYLV